MSSDLDLPRAQHLQLLLGPWPKQDVVPVCAVKSVARETSQPRIEQRHLVVTRGDGPIEQFAPCALMHLQATGWETQAAQHDMIPATQLDRGLAGMQL